MKNKLFPFATKCIKLCAEITVKNTEMCVYQKKKVKSLLTPLRGIAE